MLGLLVVLLVVAVTLTVVLWIGTVFLQGYFYTEPTQDVYWQAPAAAGALTLFLLLWCVLDVTATRTTQVLPYEPYDTLFRFSAVDDLSTEPAPRIWVIRKGAKDPILYERRRLDQIHYVYEEAVGKQRWSAVGVEAILVPRDKDSNEKIRLDLNKDADSDSRRFVSADGWGMGENNLGQPSAFRFGRFLVNVMLNLLHFTVWFLSLWLLLRFQWVHALGLALVLWLVMTLTVVPMLMIRSGEAARAGTVQVAEPTP